MAPHLVARNNLVLELVWYYFVFLPPTFSFPLFPLLSLFPVWHLVRCSELAVSALGVVLIARMTLFLMGRCQTLLAYDEANDLLDGWAAMDISVSRVSGVECPLCKAQCCHVWVHSMPDRDGI